MKGSPLVRSFSAVAAAGFALIVPGQTARADSPAKSDVVTLEAFSVGALPVQSFGFCVRILRNTETDQVTEITVTRVAPKSDAAKKGMGPLTSIRKIDGRPVQDFVASFAKGSDLNKILMHRKPGDKVTIEFLALGSTAVRTATLTEHPPEGTGTESALMAPLRFGSSGSP